MQDLVGGDNNRTPVVFQVPDIYRFVGVIGGYPRAIGSRSLRLEELRHLDKTC